MRDHWQQCQTTILGGSWGSVKGKFADMKELIEKWYKNEAKRSKADLANDQLFLKVPGTLFYSHTVLTHCTHTPYSHTLHMHMTLHALFMVPFDCNSDPFLSSLPHIRTLIHTYTTTQHFPIIPVVKSIPHHTYLTTPTHISHHLYLTTPISPYLHSLLLRKWYGPEF